MLHITLRNLFIMDQIISSWIYGPAVIVQMVLATTFASRLLVLDATTICVNIVWLKQYEWDRTSFGKRISSFIFLWVLPAVNNLTVSMANTLTRECMFWHVLWRWNKTSCELICWVNMNRIGSPWRQGGSSVALPDNVAMDVALWFRGDLSLLLWALNQGHTPDM